MAVNPGNPGLFLDLAGTLVRMDSNRELPLEDGRIRVQLMPNVAEKLRPLRDRLILIVTNQAGIARGRLTTAQVEAAITEVDRQLGGIVTAWQICPHTAEDRCRCRKPAPGMIHELAEVYGVELTQSIMVGDQEVDRQCSAAAGIPRFVFAKDYFGWQE
jgi:histidinol-phosphate phosphatase family protein